VLPNSPHVHRDSSAFDTSRALIRSAHDRGLLRDLSRSLGSLEPITRSDPKEAI
jgi:hypothetical protein